MFFQNLETKNFHYNEKTTGQKIKINIDKKLYQPFFPIEGA